MTPTAIICLGNRFVPDDDLGCRVFDHLAGTPLPAGIELIDGGLCGLNLLHLLEGRRRVIFADTVSGIGAADALVIMNGKEVAAYAGNYGHGAGLPYLLHLLPQVHAEPLPEIALVGAESPMDTATEGETMVRCLAARCVEIAIHGLS